jgi:energy-coupling factor transport system permease protein
VNLLYFVLVIGCAMALTHPVCLAVSCVCALAYSVMLTGRSALRIQLRFLLPLALAAALFNPAFSHQGRTILAYLPDGNPLTLESVWYGLFSAGLLVTVLSWFRGVHAVMTSDKLVYLFGRVVPALSLLLSMALRFVPRFTAQLRVIAEAQRCIGRDVRSGGPIRRAKSGVRILSALVTWALENAIDTADSMKSRGYGLPGRTAFAIYRFDRRDKRALAFLLLCGGGVIAGAAWGKLRFVYYPIISGAAPDAWQILLFVVYLALCGLPLWIEGREAWRWNRSLMAKASFSAP